MSRKKEKAKQFGAWKRAILQFTITYFRDNGCSPTWREVRRAIGIPPGRYDSLIRHLRENEFVSFEDNVPRSLQITPKGIELLAQSEKR